MKKALKPEQQGHIDGMCAVYSVLNACKLLFEHSEKMDLRLFKELCVDNPKLFPNIVYAGTEVAGMKSLLATASTWADRVHHHQLVVRRPFRRGSVTRVDDFFHRLREELHGDDSARTAAIIGLDAPWDHWTVIRDVTQKRAMFFDSWGFPRRTAFDYFTLNPKKAGKGKREKTMLAYSQTFVLAARPIG